MGHPLTPTAMNARERVWLPAALRWRTAFEEPLSNLSMFTLQANQAPARKCFRQGKIPHAQLVTGLT
jgi:hypothetical protein